MQGYVEADAHTHTRPLRPALRLLLPSYSLSLTNCCMPPHTEHRQREVRSSLHPLSLTRSLTWYLEEKNKGMSNCETGPEFLFKQGDDGGGWKEGGWPSSNQSGGLYCFVFLSCNTLIIAYLFMPAKHVPKNRKPSCGSLLFLHLCGWLSCSRLRPFNCRHVQMMASSPVSPRPEQTHPPCMRVGSHQPGWRVMLVPWRSGSTCSRKWAGPGDDKRKPRGGKNKGPHSDQLTPRS